MPAVVATSAENGRTLKLRPGDELEVRLEDFSTSGYRWEPDSGPQGADLIDSRYESASTAVGGSGTRVLTFRPDPQGGKIRLKLWRPTVGDSSVSERYELTIEMS